MKNYLTRLGLALVDAPNEAFLLGRGKGTQNYICQPTGSPSTALGHVAWTLFTPEATLFTDQAKQLITHFASPNPDEGGIVRVTWQDSRDTNDVPPAGEHRRRLGAGDGL